MHYGGGILRKPSEINSRSCFENAGFGVNVLSHVVQSNEMKNDAR